MVVELGKNVKLLVMHKQDRRIRRRRWWWWWGRGRRATPRRGASL
jgi:hypothetical protein